MLSIGRVESVIEGGLPVVSLYLCDHFILADARYSSIFEGASKLLKTTLMDILDPSIPGLMWVLAICFTIIVADVFFETEILSVGALVGVSIYVSLLIDVEFKWRVLVGLICWLLMTGMFYLVWKRFVTPLIRRSFTKGMNESIHSAVGAIAEFRLIDEKAFVYWNGDLWPAKHDERPKSEESSGAAASSFQDRDKVKITNVENGVLTVCAVKG